MSTINLAEAEILKTSSRIPLVWSAGRLSSEPFFDYDEEGNPQDFGIDLEPPDPTAEDVANVDFSELLYDVSPSQFAETAIRVPEAGRVTDFLFEGREYLRKIYDTSANKVLLKCGRQVEKCQREVVKVLTIDGRSVNVSDMEAGDRIIALELIDPRRQRFGPELGTGASRAETTWRFVEDVITKKKSAGSRRVLRVVTRMGSEVEVSEDTPLLSASGWLCAGELEIGDRLAAARDLRGCCRFGSGSGKHPAYLPLLGYSIADGGLSGWTVQLTKHDPVIQQRIRSLLDDAGCLYRPTKDGKSLSIPKSEPLVQWLGSDGLLGKRSREKFIPDWIFTDASKEETISFLRALWVDCDGSVKQTNPSKWEVVYASTSRTLAEQVRSLLLKFGIPSRIRRNNHPAYRDNPDPDVDQHLVRVETIEGVNRFLALFTDLPSDEFAVGDSNRDTIPRELAQPLISELCDDFGFGKRMGRGVTSPMKEWGLRVTLKYPLSMKKLVQYLDFFREYGAEEHPAFSKLFSLYDSDVIWDEVVGIADLGQQETFHLEVEKNHNYVQDHVVVHNSTTLGNRLLCYSALTNNFRSIFVAPSAEQAKVFSTDRIKDVVEASPLLKAYTTTKINQAVFFKKFINFSQIRLRYAYLNADRCIAGDAKVQLADGRLVPIRELVGVGDVDVISMGEDGLPCVSRGHHARSNGCRPVVSVITDYPAPIKCTPDHKIFTGRGWVPAEELKEGDFVLAPHVGSLLGEKSIGEKDKDGFAIAWLLGALVSEGSCADAREFRFHNNDESFIADFEHYADLVGLKLGKRVYDTRYEHTAITVSIYSDRRGAGLCGYKKDLWELGEFGARSENKTVPTRILTATLAEKCAFLGALFRGDGWCCADGEYARAGYSTASKQLAEGLSHLLWTLGIRTSISEKGPSTDNALGSYSISMNATHTTKLVGLIGEFRGGQKYREFCQRDCKDRIPVSYLWLREYLRHTYNLSTHSAWGEHRIQLRPGNRKDSIGRRVLESIADKLSDEFLKLLVSPASSWVAVRSVEDGGEEEVFDLTVDGTECFQANGLIVHNCRGIPADLVAIDEIQDILVDNIPVIEQCAFHSKYKLFLYSGTPKSLDNTLEHYWTEFSTQNEWVVPCEHHGTPKDLSSWHWNILGEKQIGKKGLICDKCGAPISATHPDAQWVSLNPRDSDNKDKVTFDSYRIPQTMVQWVNWDDILQAQEQYPRAQFMNEKLGMSYDSGVRPITKGQLKACCKEEIRLGDIEHFKRIAQGRQVYAGVDWGCHDEETRILTQDGWKYFRDLTDDDLVAQWDKDTRAMSLVEPEVRTVREWNGDLYHFETRGGVDMMLTSTHRMRVGNSVGSKWITETAEETVARGNSIKFVGQVDWEGAEQEEFVLPGLPTSPGYQGCTPITFKMDDWLEFLGYILSEGGICLTRSKSTGVLRPYCIKMSQRETVSPEKAKMIKGLMDRIGIPYTEFPNHNTGDLNWTIYGKQLWSWFADNMGYPGDQKRIPRRFLSLSKRQLQILFDALVAGDGYVDPRENCDSGAYYSTSKGLCEDFQELCIRLGRRCVVRLHKPAEGNRKTRWRAMWSTGRDYQFNNPSQKAKKVPYSGNVYCCKVPSGYIVTERNGCVAYQGNTGEGSSYTVISFGGYFGTGNFDIFWIHRFTGPDLDPERQMDLISQMLAQLQVQIAGTDYGGGFYQNDQLIRRFGPQKIMKYQYNPRQKKKVYWEPNLGRFMLHRTEIMSDVFNALKRKLISLPNWEEFREPHGSDILNIFSEYNDRLRMNEYKHAPGKPDDSFHSVLYCLMASMLQNPRPDILTPMRDDGSGGGFQR